MPDTIIQTKQLQFGYNSKQPVLKSLDLEVPKASIYGFLGSNGAGKTTTIRTILGLLKPNTGSVSVFGKSINKYRANILSNVGSLIEEPSLYLQLSGYDNLKIACKYLNIPYKKIDEVLELVNLTDQKKKVTKQYSTGMKQRLGLAIALLRDPDLLILDEPVNGLDPTGIIEIRTIIQELHQQGKTIFLSSHLLSEIEKMATHVGIIKNGEMLFQGSFEELTQLKNHQLKAHIRTNEMEKAMEALRSKYKIKAFANDVLEISIQEEEQIPSIIETLTLQKIKLYEVTIQKTDLENLFTRLITL